MFAKLAKASAQENPSPFFVPSSSLSFIETNCLNLVKTVGQDISTATMRFVHKQATLPWHLQAGCSIFFFVCVCQWSGTLSWTRTQGNIKRAVLMSPLAVFLSLIPVMASQGGQLCSHQDLLDPNTCRYEYKLTLLFFLWKWTVKVSGLYFSY